MENTKTISLEYYNQLREDSRFFKLTDLKE